MHFFEVELFYVCNKLHSCSDLMSYGNFFWFFFLDYNVTPHKSSCYHEFKTFCLQPRRPLRSESCSNNFCGFHLHSTINSNLLETVGGIPLDAMHK